MSDLLNSRQFSLSYWAHYISIEKEFASTLSYVSLSEDNFSTYSVAYEKLLLSIGSEIDVVLKQFCKTLIEGFNKESIKEYRNCIKANYPDFTLQSVTDRTQSISLKPWDSWNSTDEDNSPLWWRAYNKIKHERTSVGSIGGITKEYYKFANLEYTLNALAGLYQVLLNTYFNILDQNKKIKIPLPGSRLFTAVGARWDSTFFFPDYALYIDEDSGSLMAQYGDFSY